MTDSEGFTVRDRRGERVEGGTPEARPPGAARQPPPAPEPRPASSAGAPGAPPEPDLTALFALLANAALLHLGEPMEPGGGGGATDLAQAKFSIDLLRLLRDKTAGNLTADEGRFLEQLIYDLEMRFVRAARGR